jgi:hypothetical protein
LEYVAVEGPSPELAAGYVGRLEYVAQYATCSGNDAMRCSVGELGLREGDGHGTAVHAYRGQVERPGRVVGGAPAAEWVHDQLAGFGITKNPEREL